MLENISGKKAKKLYGLFSQRAELGFCVYCKQFGDMVCRATDKYSWKAASTAMKNFALLILLVALWSRSYSLFFSRLPFFHFSLFAVFYLFCLLDIMCTTCLSVCVCVCVCVLSHFCCVLRSIEYYNKTTREKKKTVTTQAVGRIKWANEKERCRTTCR